MGFLIYVLIGTAASFAGALLTAWLASRKRGPDAEPFVPPQVTPGTAIRVLFGTGRLPPIFTLMGPTTTEDVRQQTGTEFFGQVPIIQTVGKRYKVTAQGVLCWGMVTELRNIVFAPNVPLTDLPPTSKRVTGFHLASHLIGPPTVTVEIVDAPRMVGVVDTFTRILHGGHETLDVYAPTVFGGEDNLGGGGVWGKIEFYVGSGQHGPSSVLEALVGAGNVPSYRELAYVVLNSLVVGTRPSMPSIDFIVSAYPFPQLVAGLGSMGATVNVRTIQSRSLLAQQNYPVDSTWTVEDVCPLYPIAALMTHRQFGLARTPAELDLVQWDDVAVTTNAEGIGVSLNLTGDRQAARNMLAELWQVMDALPRRHPETNQLQVKLIRAEAYDSMRQFGPSEIVDADLTRREWADTFNEVTVFFSNADKLYEEDFVTVRDPANIAATGSVRPLSPIRLMSVTYRALALSIALRELRAVSQRLLSGTIKGTRAMWDCERGDVARFRMPWLDFDDDADHFGEAVLRIRAVNLGSPASNEVTLTVVEDVFSHAPAPAEIVDGPPDPGTVVVVATKRRPTIVPTQRQTDTTGYLDLVIVDPDTAVVSVEASTSEGGAAPSAFAELTGPPYEQSVPRSGDGPSTIAWRVMINLGGTSGDEIVSGVVTFPAAVISPNPVVVDHVSGPTPVYAKSTGQQIFVKH